MNKFLVVIASLAFLALWVFFFLNPLTAFESIVLYVWIISVIIWAAMAIRGIVVSAGRGTMLAMWIVNLLFWIAVLAFPVFFSGMLIILLWIWVLVLGIAIFGISFDLKAAKVKWWRLCLIVGLLTIAMWIVVITDPIILGVSIWILLGITFMLYGIALFAWLFWHKEKLEKKK